MMVENHCEYTVEGGVYCCNKPVQIVVEWQTRNCFCVCRKHKYHKTKDYEVINLKKFALKQEGVQE